MANRTLKMVLTSGLIAFSAYALSNSSISSVSPELAIGALNTFACIFALALLYKVYRRYFANKQVASNAKKGLAPVTSKSLSGKPAVAKSAAIKLAPKPKVKKLVSTKSIADFDVPESAYIKLLMVGDQSTGKTCFGNHLDGNGYNEKYNPTIQVDHISSKFPFYEMDISLNITDAPGNEELQIFALSCYASTQIFLLFFDVTNKSTFANLGHYLKNIVDNNKNEQRRIVLVASKLDGDKQTRKVSYKQAQAFVKQENLHGYIEVSAKENKCSLSNLKDRGSIRAGFREMLMSQLEKIFSKKTSPENDNAEPKSSTQKMTM